MAGVRRAVGRERALRRAELIEFLAARIAGIARPHPVRVAIDGPDAAGKTTLADEVAADLERRGRHVVRASLDAFHRPRAKRYARGADSPEGYYRDSFDYRALDECLLGPLGPGGTRRYRTAAFDHARDARVAGRAGIAAPDSVLLLDGLFLLRPELRASWDLSVLVTASPAEILRRAKRRDLAALGTEAEVERRYRARYLPAQEIYVREADPIAAADVVVDNDVPESPRLIEPRVA